VSDASPTVRYWRDEPPNALAAMIGGLLDANLSAHPERSALLARRATVAILATDVDVGATIRLGEGRAIVRNGVIGDPDVVVRAESGALMGMSSVPTRFGLPDVSKPEARAMLRRVATGKLRVKGVVTRGSTLNRFSKLMSVD
jgi:hypothetical protein